LFQEFQAQRNLIACDCFKATRRAKGVAFCGIGSLFLSPPAKIYKPVDDTNHKCTTYHIANTDGQEVSSEEIR
jgi:hypothetical protein